SDPAARQDGSRGKRVVSAGGEPGQPACKTSACVRVERTTRTGAGRLRRSTPAQSLGKDCVSDARGSLSPKGRAREGGGRSQARGSAETALIRRYARIGALVATPADPPTVSSIRPAVSRYRGVLRARDGSRNTRSRSPPGGSHLAASADDATRPGRM